MLINKSFMEIFPRRRYSRKRQFEAIVRFIAYITLFLYICTNRVQTLISGIVTIISIYLYYKLQLNKEFFENQGKDNSMRQMPRRDNPLMNVMMTDYRDNPERLPAMSDELVKKEINYYTQSPELYSSLGDNYENEVSMRQFYSTASTVIPNAQGDFGQFCYGNMPSCKEGHLIQCEKNNSNNRRIF